MMKLNETVEMMNSANYKERFGAVQANALEIQNGFISVRQCRECGMRLL